MKIITFKFDPSQTQYRVGALISDDTIVDLTSLVSDKGLSAAEQLTCLDLDSAFIDRARDAVNAGNAETIALADVTVAASVPKPGKIICIGLNYSDHAAETGQPLPKFPIIFSKYANTVIATGDSIVLPRVTNEVDYEAELGFVIGKTCDEISIATTTATNSTQVDDNTTSDTRISVCSKEHTATKSSRATTTTG